MTTVHETSQGQTPATSISPNLQQPAVRLPVSGNKQSPLPRNDGNQGFRLKPVARGS